MSESNVPRVMADDASKHRWCETFWNTFDTGTCIRCALFHAQEACPAILSLGNENRIAFHPYLSMKSFAACSTVKYFPMLMAGRVPQKII